MNQEEKIACARIVVAVILADAEINDQERAFLEEVFTDLGLSHEERRQAYAELSVGDGPGDVAKAFQSEEAKRKALSLAHSAMHIDGEAVPTERQIVTDIVKQFGLSMDAFEEEATRRVASLRRPEEK
jgi:tellurite resistance protein